MKSIFAAIIAVLVFVPGSGLANINQRHEWWKIRLKGLTEEQKSLEKQAGLDPAVMVLTAADIKRAEKMLALFVQNSGKDASLRHEKKIFTESEIEAQTRQTAPPLCTLLLLENLINTAGSSGTVLKIQQAAGELLRERIKSEFGIIDEPLIKSIMEEDIRKTEWQYMCQETVFLRMLNSRDELIESCLKKISGKAIQEVGTRNSPVTIDELKDIILNASTECTEDILDIHISKITPHCLNDSWTWRRISERCTADFSSYKRIRKMLGSSFEDAPLTLIRDFYKNPDKLERRIFGEAQQRYLERKGSGGNGYPASNSGSNTLVLIIPRDIEGAMLYKEINSLRINTAASITGREDDEFYISLEKKFQVPFEKYIRDARDTFYREEEKTRLTKEKNSSIIVINEHDFFSARGLFDEKTGLVRGYILKSIEFIRWISETRKTDGDRFIGNYKARLSMNRQFLEMLRSLVHTGSGCAEYDAPGLHQRYTHFVKRTEDVLRSIGYTSAIAKNDQRFLTPSRRQEILNRKSEFADSVKLTRTDIASMHLSFRKMTSASEKKRAGMEESLRGKIAQQEVHLLMEKIDDYAKVYERMNHAPAAFQSYAEAYSGLREEIGKEKVSENLDRAIMLRSIIPIIKEFNPGQLKIEHRTKAYLEKEIRRDLSRLITLLNNYRQKGVELEEKPASDYSRVIMSRLKERPSIPVATWQMNEANFEEIDRKVMEKLSRERNRILWHCKAGTGEPSSGDRGRMDIPELKIALTIPEGWTSGEANSGEGILRTYNSHDMKSSMLIMRMPLEGRTVQEIAALQVRKSRGTAVRHRWGHRDGLDYFWVIAREADGSLTEIYSIRSGNDALLLSGSSPKDKYTLFKSKFDAVFNSLKQ